MSNEALVAGGFLQELQMAAVMHRVTNGKPIKVDADARPFTAFLDSRRKPLPFAHNKEGVELKTRPEGSGQTWKGDVTLQTPGEIRVHHMFAFKGFNFFDNHKLINDHLADQGYIVDANTQYGPGNPRFKGSQNQYQLLKQLVQDKVDGFIDRISYNKDLQYHRVGANPTDCDGLMAMLPLSMTGQFGGIERAGNPWAQHIVAAGAAGGTNAPNILPSATIGASGTLLTTIQKVYRQAKRYVVRSGHAAGKWRIFGGERALDKVSSEYQRIGVQWNKDAARGGEGGVDLTMLDEDLKLGRIPVGWDPTIDAIDELFPAERQNGVSQLTVTLSGGGASRQGRAVAYVNAAGEVAAIVVVDPGAGYTSAPSIAIGNAGGGTGATFQAHWFGTGSAATGKVIVEADDVRIGRLSHIEVTAPGSGYATTGAVTLQWTDCLFLLWEPSWCLGYRGTKGGSFSKPAEDARKRNVEHQYDSYEGVICDFPRANAVIHIAG
jgi:hypothetical protein